MKTKFYFFAVLLLLVCFCSAVSAQTEIDIDGNGRPYSSIFDSLTTGGLIPSRIPYGTLYDRVYGWSGLSSWNNGDTTSSAHLFQSWSDAEKSVVSASARPNNYPAMRTAVQQNIFVNTLPVIAINFRFGYFDSTCAQDGRITVTNGMLRDNNGASPYLTKQITLAGIGTDSVFTNKTYSVLYNNSLMLNNTATTIQNITLDNLTSGAQKILTSGTSQTMQFTQAGDNILRLTVKLNNGSSFVTKQIVKAKPLGDSGTFSRTGGTVTPQLLEGPSCPPTNELIASSIPFKGYGETQATNSYADYHIFYHATNSSGTACEQVLRKPVIVLDGFDPKDDRNYIKIYSEYLKNSDDGTSLGDAFRKRGYDVIILNFPKLGNTIDGINGVSNLAIPSNVKVNGTSTTVNAFDRDGGTDYIERNAFLLVSLIQEVNRRLVGSEKIVVVGPSMGGQISRYALAYMEKQQSLGVANMNHNCRLWVSFDSPHSGANVPLTVQETLRFYGTEGEKEEARDNYQSQVRPPAARQLLIEQLDGKNSTASYHSTYYANLQNNGLAGSNGYPVNVRKVTLLNGTGNSRQTYGDYAKVLDGVGRKTFLNVKVFELEENFMPSYNQTKRITQERIAVPRFLGVSFISKDYSVTNVNPRGCMDAVQGSTISTINDVYTQFSAALKKDNVNQTWAPVFPNHCFIPSISALGFKSSNFDWNNRVDNRNLLCNNEINFDNYYIPPVNQEHIFLNTGSIDWLTQEVNKGQPGCPKICSFAIVGGSDPLCTTANATYNLDVNIPSGASTQWTTSPSLQIVSYTPNSVTVRQVSYPTYSAITATIVNPCGANAVITRNIQTGPPSITGISYSMYGTCAGGVQSWNLAATANTTINTWKWTVDNPANNSWYISQPTSAATTVDVTNGTGGGITISATGACGTGKGGVTIWSPCGRKMTFAVLPNPTAGIVIVSVLSEDVSKGFAAAATNFKNNQERIYQIQVVDQMGKVRKQYKFNGVKSASINLQDLAPNTYFIKMFDGVTWQSTIVLKK